MARNLSIKFSEKTGLDLKNKLSEAVLKGTSIKRRRNNEPLGWSKNIDKVRKRKRNVDILTNGQNHSDLLKYKKALGIANTITCYAKCSYEGKLALHVNDDPKAFYKYACRKMKMNDTVGPLTDEVGYVIPDDGLNARLLNEYFASIFTKENLVDIPMCERASYVNALNTVDFTDETVCDKLCKLRADKSGLDGIHAVVKINIRKCYLQLISIQRLLCNIVPHDWKCYTSVQEKSQNKRSSY